LSQTAGLADGATDAFSAVAYWLKQWPGAEVLVIGGSGQSIGMFAVQAALSRGARRVVYLDDHPQRLAKARSLGAEVHEAPKGLAMEPIGLFPIVVDAAATDASILLAFRSAEPNGICQRMYGDFAETTPVPLRHMYGVGITLRVGRVNVRAEMPLYRPRRRRAFPSRACHHPAGSLRGRARGDRRSDHPGRLCSRWN